MTKNRIGVAFDTIVGLLIFITIIVTCLHAGDIRQVVSVGEYLTILFLVLILLLMAHSKLASKRIIKDYLQKRDRKNKKKLEELQ